MQCFFFFVVSSKIKEQEGRIGSASVGGGRGGERAWEGEYGANTVYTRM
jgi:hypothetical protein